MLSGTSLMLLYCSPFFFKVPLSDLALYNKPSLGRTINEIKIKNLVLKYTCIMGYINIWKKITCRAKVCHYDFGI